MIFYITSETNKNKYDFLNDLQVLKKNVKPYITVESILNFIKKDLRNLEVEYLIIDLLVLQVDEPNSIEEAMEAFQMLNKDGRVIISAIGEDEEIRKQWNDFCLGKFEVIFQEDEVHSEIMRILNIVNEIENLEEQKDDYTENKKSEEVESKNKRISIKDMNKDKETLPNTEATQEFVKEINQVSPDKLYKKAIDKVKTNEGKAINKVILQDDIKKQWSEKKKEDSKVKNKKVIVKQNKVITLDEYLMKNVNVNDETLSWNCKNIFIGVIGTERKVGTTTAAIQLANALAYTGASVSYTESNIHEHLNLIASSCDMEVIEDYFYKNSVTYYPNNQFNLDAGYHFIIFDLGTMNEKTDWVKKVIDNLIHEVILVTGSKPYEEKALINTIKKLQDRNITLVCNNATKEEYEQIHEKYQMDEMKCYQYGYDPDLFSKNSWLQHITELFYKYNNI